MNNDYLQKLEKLLIQDKSVRLHKLEFKNVFGAVGGYVNGRIFISCGKFGVALKLPPETLTELFRERGVSHLRYFPKGHIKKEYAVIPQRIIDDEGHFGQLLGKSIQHSLSLLP